MRTAEICENRSEKMTPPGVPIPPKSFVTDAEDTFEPVTMTGSHSHQVNTATTVDSGEITATPLFSKKAQEKHEAYMKRKMLEAGSMNFEFENQTYQSQVNSGEDPMVHSPPHYNLNEYGIECIDAIRASLGSQGFAAYCKGNVTKYLWRYETKNGLQDLEKAQWYLKKLIEHLSDEV